MGAMAAFYHDSTDITDAWQREVATIRMIAKMPTIVAWAYKYSVGQPFVYPRNSLDYASNFLNMCFAVPAEDYVVDPILSRAMDRIFTLHADHEQNASTSTVRLASSSGANPFACIAAGVACLWGPAHGGANEACLRMLREIGTVDRIPEFIARAKDKDDPFRLMGFGHRVYKNFDPRAKVMKQSADEVLGLLGIENNPTLQVAKELERIALEDEYFIEKKLYPNVDFYSGIILDAIGFPTSMFTPIFALARTVGWISQWKEMLEDPRAEDRPAAAALHRQDLPRLRGCRGPLSAPRAPRSPGSAADAARLRARHRAGAPRRGHPHRRRRGARLRLRARPDRQVDRLPRGGRRPARAVPDRRRQPRRSGQGRRAGRASRWRRRTPRASAPHTGFAIGGVAPLGHLTPIETWLDPRLLALRGGLGRGRHAAPRLLRRAASRARPRRSAPRSPTSPPEPPASAARSADRAGRAEARRLAAAAEELHRPARRPRAAPPPPSGSASSASTAGAIRSGVQSLEEELRHRAGLGDEVDEGRGVDPHHPLRRVQPVSGLAS